MSLLFTADEIFEMGVRIETNGKAFYEEAARKSAETAVREFFRELAAWEDQHIELFERLRAALPADARQGSLFDPGSELGDYLAASADSHVFVRNADVGALVAACPTPVAIIDLALTFEKDSVVYYTTMKKVVPVNQGRDAVERLIDEEIAHIALLAKRREKLLPKG